MGTVACKITDGIATVTFTNPPKGFFTSDMVAQTRTILADLDNNDEVRVVVFTGGLPDVFIRHFSVEEIIEMTAGLKARRAKGLADPRFARTPLRLLWEEVDNFRKPTIAAINGFCGGGGCELALACDIRVGAEGSSYAVTSSKIGTVAGAGGTQRLPRIVGPAKALEIMFAGDPVDAVEAYRIGLINRLAPKGQALAEAKKMVAVYEDRAPLSLAWIKRSVHRGMQMDLASALEFETFLVSTIYQTADRKEGIGAFLGKRKAKFSGK